MTPSPPTRGYSTLMQAPLLLTMTIALAGGAVSAQAAAPRLDAMKREYWLVKPARFQPQKTYWMVVLAHGFRGKGQDILWLRRALQAFDDCLIVAPSFPEGFQLLEARTDQQLLALHKALAAEFRLHAKIFIAGFSAGAQFAHRFTMRHPDQVIGCAAHAGGTWGPSFNLAAAPIPMALSCGLDDIERSSIGQTRSRIQAARDYFRKLAAAGFHLKARLYQGLGHATSPAVEALLAECYQLATRGLYSAHAQVLQREVLGLASLKTTAEQLTATARWTPERFAALGRNPDRRSAMGASWRLARRFAHTTAGLGGNSKDGRRYWIDDGQENTAGWSSHATAETARREILGRYLANLRDSHGHR